MNESMNLSKAALEARREYKRRWRQANPEKVQEANRKYWERRAERETAAKREVAHDE